MKRVDVLQRMVDEFRAPEQVRQRRIESISLAGLDGWNPRYCDEVCSEIVSLMKLDVSKLMKNINGDKPLLPVHCFVLAHTLMEANSNISVGTWSFPIKYPTTREGLALLRILHEARVPMTKVAKGYDLVELNHPISKAFRDHRAALAAQSIANLMGPYPRDQRGPWKIGVVKLTKKLKSVLCHGVCDRRVDYQRAEFFDLRLGRRIADRFTSELEAVELSAVDGILAVDYYGGPEFDVSPKGIDALFTNVESLRYVVLVVQRFLAPYGYSGDSAWYRDGHTVHWASDRHEIVPSHPDLHEYAYPGSYKGIMWQTVVHPARADHNAFQRILITRTDGEKVPCEHGGLPGWTDLVMAREPEPLNLTLSSIYTRVKNVVCNTMDNFVETRVLVHDSVVTEVINSTIHVSLDGSFSNTVGAKVLAALNRHRPYVAVREKFPSWATDYRMRVTSAMHLTIIEQRNNASRSADRVSTHALTVRERNLAFAQKIAPSSSRLWTVGILLLMAIVLLRPRKGKVASGSFLNPFNFGGKEIPGFTLFGGWITPPFQGLARFMLMSWRDKLRILCHRDALYVIFHAFVEEVLKRLLSLALRKIGVYEAAARNTPPVLLALLEGSSPKAVSRQTTMHMTFAKFGLFTSTVLHTLCNLGVVTEVDGRRVTSLWDVGVARIFGGSLVAKFSAVYNNETNVVDDDVVDEPMAVVTRFDELNEVRTLALYRPLRVLDYTLPPLDPVAHHDQCWDVPADGPDRPDGLYALTRTFVPAVAEYDLGEQINLNPNVTNIEIEEFNVRMITRWSPDDGYHLIMYLGVPMAKPVHTFNSALATLWRRVCIDVEQEPEVMMTLWKGVRQLGIDKVFIVCDGDRQRFGLPLTTDAEAQNALFREHGRKAWPIAKRRLYDAAYSTLDLNPLHFVSERNSSCNFMPKRDEVLIKQTMNCIKPRLVMAFAPRQTVSVSGWVYCQGLTLKAKLWFHSEPNTPFAHITMTYGAGRTADALSEWMTRATENDGIHVMVAGDDVIVVFTDEQGFIIIEFDASHCDLSNTPIIMEYEFDTYVASEVPKHVLANLESQSIATAIDRKRDFSIKLDRAPQRATGGSNTTCGNTITVGSATIAVVHAWNVDGVRRAPEEACAAMVREYRRYGFVMKSRLAPMDVNGGTARDMGTFLKGTWSRGLVRTDGRVREMWIWYRLPSFFLKSTKVTRDPCVLYRRIARERTALSAAACHMALTAKSLLSYPWPVVIQRVLEAWYGRFSSALKSTTASMADFDERHWTTRVETTEGFASSVVFYDDQCLSQWAHRYSVSEQALFEFFELLAALPLGAALCGEVPLAFARVDYW